MSCRATTRPPPVVEIDPGDGTEGVALDARMASRFSKPPAHGSVAAEFAGPDGVVDLRLVAAEEGRLLFLTPQTRLQPETRYQLVIQGGVDSRGVPLRAHSTTFLTAPEETPATPDVDTELWSARVTAGARAALMLVDHSFQAA